MNKNNSNKDIRRRRLQRRASQLVRWQWSKQHLLTRKQLSPEYMRSMMPAASFWTHRRGASVQSLAQRSIPPGNWIQACLAWVKAGCVHLGWQVTLRDPTWQVTLCSFEMCSHEELHTPYNPFNLCNYLYKSAQECYVGLKNLNVKINFH